MRLIFLPLFVQAQADLTLLNSYMQGSFSSANGDHFTGSTDGRSCKNA